MSDAPQPFCYISCVAKRVRRGTLISELSSEQRKELDIVVDKLEVKWKTWMRSMRASSPY